MDKELVKAQRKIQDLEISIKQLLLLNHQLEKQLLEFKKQKASDVSSTDETAVEYSIPDYLDDPYAQNYAPKTETIEKYAYPRHQCPSEYSSVLS